MSHRIAAPVLAVVLALAAGTGAAAAPTAQQRAEAAALGTLLTKAGNLYKESKFKEAGEIIKDVQTRLDKLVGEADEQLLTQVEPIHKRLVNAHALLELEAVTLAELKPLPDKPAPKAAAKAVPGKKGGKSAAGVSFVRDVAPILNSRCGGCHVRGRRGMFSMATYESLMTGPPAGKVVFPGNVPGSDLIVKVEDKEMPPNGGGIPDAELAMLKKWVEEGARFDGPSPTVQITMLIPGGSQQAAATPATIQAPTGSETISFAKDIAPVLAQNCTGCHGTNNPRGNLSLFTMARLMRGGDRGEPVLPGKGADSLIVKKLRGTADGARMPMGRGPLDDATIAKFQKWIEEGAKFDGPDSDQPVAEVAAVAKAQGATHEQLSADRIVQAEENWRLGMPGAPVQKKESANFLILGKVGESVLTDVSEKAEAMATKVGDILKAPRDQPLVKGRMTLFVFGERYDYTEFGKMVEKRDLPPAWRGHFRYTIVDNYGAVLMPRATDYSLDTLVAQQIGAMYVASQGRGVPHWFAEGVGRAIAARLAPASDQRVARWDDELSGALGTLAKPEDFQTGQLPPELADVCSFSFAKFVMSDNKRFIALLDGLRKGGEFGKAFIATYGATPAQVAAVWYRNPPRVKRGK
jgi:mono/diheme cytochrome c family protein